MNTPKSKAPTLTPIEQQAEDIVRAMVSQSWNEEIETIARLLRENERIQKTLWTATESAVSMAQGLDESKKLVAEKSQETDQLKLQNERFREDIKRLNEESDRLVQDRAAAIRDQEHALNLYVNTKKQHDEAIWLMNKATLEFNKTRAQLAATEEALQQAQRESAELRTKYETHCGYWDGPLMRIANAAVVWADCDDLGEAINVIHNLEAAVAEYRALIKPALAQRESAELRRRTEGFDEQFGKVLVSNRPLEITWVGPDPLERKVTNAAVAVSVVSGAISRVIRRNEFLGITANLLVSAEVATLHAFKEAVAEYRAVTEPLANQAALDASLERLGDEGKLEEMNDSRA